MNILNQISSLFLRNRTFRRVLFSFAFRLAILDFKKNLLLLVFWLLLFGMITNNVATKFGIPYLFLGPEYFNELGFLSYFIVGFSYGGFIMAYNISSFIKNAPRFPFLASLRFPFMKYCFNNASLPIIFLIVYWYQIFGFLTGEGVLSTPEIYLMMLSLLAGTVTFLIFTFSYFWSRSNDLFKLFGVETIEEKRYRGKRDTITGERNPNLVHERRDWYVETYLTSPFRVRLVRSVKHYKIEMLQTVITESSHSAFVFQIFSIISLIGLGFVDEVSVFQLPASASVFLLFTMLLMFFSSIYRWFGGWSTIVFLFLFLGFNYSYKFDFLAVDRIYGLTYNGAKADYSIENLKAINGRQDLIKMDKLKTLSILNKWKAKNTSALKSDKKPKMVFVNCSGGGLRSTLWTFYAMQQMDSLLGGKLLAKTQLITGSSGGMVGAAYLRELYLRKQKKEINSYYDKKYLGNISKDFLNPIAFKIATSEWFFSMQSFDLDGNSYPKDRAYAFERVLNDNTGNVFENKRLYDYYLPELDSKIPMMIFSPSILNDGRKLLVSSQNISYLTNNSPTNRIIYQELYPTIEYLRFFQKQGAINTMFTSAMRMSATFPYVAPSASLPSEPSVEIIDAGFRDNFGLETTLRFLHTFNDWIDENTSGVVIIQMRDKAKVSQNKPQPALTLLDALARPVGSCYSNLFNVQDYNQNEQIQMANSWCKAKVEFVNLELNNLKDDRISLNWHLTQQEKRKVLNSLDLESNKKAVERVVELLK